MITLKRYSEHQVSRPAAKTIQVLGKSGVIRENRGSWQSGILLETGHISWLSTYQSKKSVFANIAKDVIKYIGHAQQSLSENFSADWLKSLADDIVSWHNDFFELGILQTIQPYSDGIELEYTDSQYSEELDDLGVDHTLDTDIYIDVVFHGIPEDTERLISLGLQDIPDDYEIKIFVEYAGSNKSIFGFNYKESKQWYFDQADLASTQLADNTVNGVIKWCITNLVSRWVASQNQRALTRLVKLATSVKKSQD
jgi:hypothetical protein